MTGLQKALAGLALLAALVAAGTIGAAGIGHKYGAWPLPTEDTDIELRVFRLPLVDITDAGDEEFEIDEQHHMALLLWAKAMAYGKEDAETFNKSKRDDYEVRFRSYCAEAKKEQGRLRRDVGVVAYGGL